MHDLLRKQSIKWILGVFLLLTVHQGFGQKELYREDHDDMDYYFGLTLSYNHAYLHQTKSLNFLRSDSILVAEPGASGGISLGLMATFRIDDHFQYRINPQLIIGGSKYLAYNLGSTVAGEPSFQEQILPANIVSFPLQIKFNSDRIGNFRTYMMAGLKFDIDLASNSSARNAENLVKLSRYDYGYEAGIGFNFYLPFVTISPELKISNGLKNLHQVDPALKFSNNLEQILSRMIVFQYILRIKNHQHMQTNLIKNTCIVNEGKRIYGDLLIRNGRIEKSPTPFPTTARPLRLMEAINFNSWRDR